MERIAPRSRRVVALGLGLGIGLLAIGVPVSAAPSTPPSPDETGTNTAAEADKPDALVTEARALLAKIRQEREETESLEAHVERIEGPDKFALSARLTRRKLAMLADFHALVDNITRQEEQGLDTTEFRGPAEASLARVCPLIRKEIERLENESERTQASLEKLEGLARETGERRLTEVDESLDTLYRAYVDHVDRMDALGVDASVDREFLISRLTSRAEILAARIEYDTSERKALGKRASDSPAVDSLRSEIGLLGNRIDASSANLRTTVAMLERLGVPTQQYRELLVTSSGTITPDLLDRGVMGGLVRKWWGLARSWIVDNAPTIVIRGILVLVILLGFRWLARVARRVVDRAVSAAGVQTSELLRRTIVGVSSKTVLVVGVLIALSQLGVSPGPLLAGLGIAGFIVGFALQDTLGNFAAGMMVLIYRPYDVGDIVEGGGVFGKVENMTLVSTTILTFDNQTLVVPNRKIWGDVIKNVTAQDVRRVDLTFGISYSDDIAKAETVLRSILDDHEHVLKDPPHVVKVHTLGESSVDFVVRPWVRKEHYWDVYWDVTREVKLRFDREGISIPFPQRDVHLYREDAAPSAGA